MTDGKPAPRGRAEASRVQAGLTLRELDRNQFLANLDACAGVYAAAMNPPVEQLPGRYVIMERHSGYAAFRAIAAIVLPAGEEAAGATAADRGAADGTGPLLVGFAYGFHGSGGQWWRGSTCTSAISSESPNQSSAAPAPRVLAVALRTRSCHHWPPEPWKP